MARNKIDFGIDLGTTNSAIAKMVSGESKILRAEANKDIMPSAVYINKKGSILLGDPAVRAHRSECGYRLDNRKIEPNTFIEFKRTMGTNESYYSSNADRNFSPEELSAEVLKKLKSFELEEEVDAAIITIPAAFNINQVDATRKAAEISGLQYVELLQEPIAASMAYGLDSKSNEGFWMVFDFGGGTFDSALIKVEDGIMKIVDTEGNNRLGGKNLDLALVDQVIIPHIMENYNINKTLEDDQKRKIYRDYLKFNAEDLKNQLSFKQEWNLYVDRGDAREDDEGEEIEIDITLSQDELRKTLSPIFQEAIDATKTLLQRNNFTGQDLDEIILVGGPTLSPVLRQMLTEQIKAPDLSTDPMTVVAKGAGIYASTIDIPDNIREKSRDKTKIQLDIAYEATSVETEEFVTIKSLPDKTEGKIPDKLFAEIKRQDGAWNSEKIEVNEIGDVIEAHLNEGKNNLFKVVLTDDTGNTLDCEPEQFSIVQGSKVDSATLPHNMGIEVIDKDSGKGFFKTVEGLEKNKPLKARGKYNDLKNQRPLRPGNKEDYIKIPIYQGEPGADGSRAIYNEHVYDIIISGKDLPSYLPENSPIDLTITVDRSQKITLEAYFNYLDYTTEIEVPEYRQSVETDRLAREIEKAKFGNDELKKSDNVSESKYKELDQRLNNLENQFSQNREDVDNKLSVLKNLRSVLKDIDNEKDKIEWPQLEKQLKNAFYDLEKINSEKGDERTTQAVDKFQHDVDKVIQYKDKKLAPQLIEDINSYAFELERLEHLIGFVRYIEDNFDNINWNDVASARQSINRAKEIITDNPTLQRIQPIVNDLFDNGGFGKQAPQEGFDVNLLKG